MDIEYIKMADCPEIQRLRRQGQTGDWIYGDIFSNGVDAYVVMHDSFPVSGFTWLPTQSQLQDMVKGKDSLLDDFEIFFYEFFGGFDGVNTCYELPDWAKLCKSWEQLWLAFVMKEKYNKTWNGNEWVGK